MTTASRRRIASPPCARVARVAHFAARVLQYACVPLKRTRPQGTVSICHPPHRGSSERRGSNWLDGFTMATGNRAGRRWLHRECHVAACAMAATARHLAGSNDREDRCPSDSSISYGARGLPVPRTADAGSAAAAPRCAFPGRSQPSRPLAGRRWGRALARAIPDHARRRTGNERARGTVERYAAVLPLLRMIGGFAFTSRFVSAFASGGNGLPFWNAAASPNFATIAFFSMTKFGTRRARRSATHRVISPGARVLENPRPTPPRAALLSATSSWSATIRATAREMVCDTASS